MYVEKLPPYGIAPLEKFGDKKPNQDSGRRFLSSSIWRKGHHILLLILFGILVELRQGRLFS